MNASMDEMQVGKLRGWIAEPYRCPELLSKLPGIADWVLGPEAVVVSSGRHRNVTVPASVRGLPLRLFIKSFGRQGALKDRLHAWRGSKAKRSCLAARALRDMGVGTPSPVGFLERWEGRRLKESYFVSECAEGVTTFRDALIELFRHERECAAFMSLLDAVAKEIWRMHEAGVRHNDLGNQNILVGRGDDGRWAPILFTDLNRARLGGRLSIRERARDLSRIYLPSDLLRVFKEMYWQDAQPPSAFQRWERLYRSWFAWHTLTRRLRHPVRSRRRRAAGERDILYPAEKDMWIWDERSAQAISVMRPRDRSRHYPLIRHLSVARGALALAKVWPEYRALRASCFGSPVAMQDRIGVAMRPRAASLDRELDLLRRLGRLPVFLRFHHHETREQWDFTASVARRLHAEGHRVSAGLLQDRRAVLEPSSWRAFVAYVLGRVGDAAEWVECGHAINRVKWGLWDFREYGELMRGVADAGALHPAARLMGPAVIDFEYPFVTAALQHLPAGMRFHALSHHLYVDRRGAPESEQHGFSAVEKFALARAIARRSAVCDDRLVVSEVNWPIRGTGVYSPVNSPYESTGVRFNDPSVSEDNYADYMIRYLLLAVCSGMVERVFWWRLVARGFGLVDDTDPHAWRERPAYAMLRVFLARLGGATFSRRTGGGKRGDSAGIHAFCFVLPDGAETCVAYSTRGEVETALPFEVGEVRDAFDCAIQPEARRRSVVRLSGRPVYLLGDQPASRSR